MGGSMNGGGTLSVSKRVQELSIDGDELPQQFIVTDEVNHSSIPLAEIPIIDLSLLSAGSQDELNNLRSALSSWGCFHAVGHGISSFLVNDMRDQIKQFFSLPMEEKEKYSRQLGEAANPEGYGHDHVYSDKQILDWSDRVILTLLPEENRHLNFWPENPASFQDVVHEYSLEMKAMIHLVLKAIARSLNLEEKSFITPFGEQATLLGRFLFYPACSKPDKVLGIKAHTDSTSITVILPDTNVLGLQVLKDEEWHMVPLVPQAFFVNLGDQIVIMSNGILKSPRHRVAVNSEKERITIAVFYLPDEETEIGPIEDLITDMQPRLYRNVRNYRALNMKCFQAKKIPLDTLKL